MRLWDILIGNMWDIADLPMLGRMWDQKGMVYTPSRERAELVELTRRPITIAGIENNSASRWSPSP
jgi:hypothetical protein